MGMGEDINQGPGVGEGGNGDGVGDGDQGLETWGDGNWGVRRPAGMETGGSLAPPGDIWASGRMIQCPPNWRNCIPCRTKTNPETTTEEGLHCARGDNTPPVQPQGWM